MMKAINLESERLVMIPLSLNHLSQEYVDWMNDPLVNKYLESGGDYSMEKLKLFLEENEKKNILFWAIHLKSANKHIGNIKIDPLNVEENSGEYGILIGEKEEWGKGYAKEATLAVLDHCFKELKFSEITLGVIEKNVSALQLYKNIGFSVERVEKGIGVYEGEKCNSVRMILRNE